MTALKILLILYLLFMVAVLVKFKNGKDWAIIKWSLVIFSMGIFGFFTEWLMFFPAWYTRNIPLAKWLFWIWLDDSRIGSEDHMIFLNGNKETLWNAYKWHLRNRVWNLDGLLRPRKGERKIIETIVDDLWMDSKKLDQSLSWVPMARLKYWNNGIEGPQVNTGEMFSIKHSILGKGYVWETIGKRLTFRYSFVELRRFLFWYVVIVVVFGENDKRVVFTIKIKKQLPWRY